MSRLLVTSGLADPLEARLAAGLPVLGTCAGMILLARTVLDGRDDQRSYDAIDITVRRNAFGRQLASFEDDIHLEGIAGGPVRGIFIRAPWVEETGEGIEVLAEVNGHPVAVRQDNVAAISFHPERTGDDRVHAWFASVADAA